MDRTRTIFLGALLAVATPALAPAQAVRSTPRTPAGSTAASDTVHSASTAAPPVTAAARGVAARPAVPAQVLRVGDVLIEGKLYSPHALFILSRPEERFGRDVVVPQVLQLQRTAALLPYRLRPEILAAERVALEGAADATETSIVPRRSP